MPHFCLAQAVQEGAAVEGPPAMGLSLQTQSYVRACCFQVDRTTGGKVMGIFRQQRN